LLEQQQPKRRQQQPKQPKRQPKQPKQQRQQRQEQQRQQQEQRLERLRQQQELLELRFQQLGLPEQRWFLLFSSKRSEQQPAGRRSAEFFSWFFLDIKKWCDE
jgi:hypothetical protein